MEQTTCKGIAVEFKIVSRQIQHGPQLAPLIGDQNKTFMSSFFFFFCVVLTVLGRVCESNKFTFNRIKRLAFIKKF
jgi:hypothetical protein